MESTLLILVRRLRKSLDWKYGETDSTSAFFHLLFISPKETHKKGVMTSTLFIVQACCDDEVRSR